LLRANPSEGGGAKLEGLTRWFGSQPAARGERGAWARLEGWFF